MVLAGCNSQPAGTNGEMVACATDGQAAFSPVCQIERAIGPKGLVLTISKPGGGFRRLLVTHDGRGVIAADGAEAAQINPLGENLIEVRLGQDRYRLPATVGMKP